MLLFHRFPDELLEVETKGNRQASPTHSSSPVVKTTLSDRNERLRIHLSLSLAWAKVMPPRSLVVAVDLALLTSLPGALSNAVVLLVVE